MSKKDKIKEKIIGLRFWLGIAVATLLAIVGWVATNYQKAEMWLVVASFVLAVICACLAIIFVRKIDRRIDELEDL